VWWPIQKTPIHNAAVAQTVMFALLPGWFAVCCSCRTWQDFSDSWFWDIHLVRTWLVHCCKKTSQHFQEKGGIALNLAPGCELQELLSEAQGEPRLFQNTLSCRNMWKRSKICQTTC
jgi:hypothetical protein